MAGFTYLWEFRIKPDRHAEFERHYGPDGTWARLFRRSPGYAGTVLLRDEAEPSRYVTVDQWEDVESYGRFREEFSSEYCRLDEACANLTVHETLIGKFTVCVP